MGSAVLTEDIKSRSFEILPHAHRGVRIYTGPLSTMEADLITAGIIINAQFPGYPMSFCRGIKIDYYGAEYDGTVIAKATASYSSSRAGSRTDEEGNIEDVVGYTHASFKGSLSSQEVFVSLLGTAIKQWAWDPDVPPNGAWTEELATLSPLKPQAVLHVDAVRKRVNTKGMIRALGKLNKDPAIGYKAGQWLILLAEIEQQGDLSWKIALEFGLNIPGWNINQFGEPNVYIDKEGKKHKLIPHSYQLYDGIQFSTTFGTVLKKI